MPEAAGPAEGYSRERRGFRAAVLALTALALVPIWAHDIPPLQDYPYHLAQVEVLRAERDGESPYAEHYVTDLGLRPYAAFYAVALGLSRVIDVESAGKAALSLYFLLFGALLWEGARRERRVPWASLVLLPLAIHPSYYLGFLNYLLSLPLLALALEDLERFGRGAKRVGPRLGLWVTGLFVTHPFTYLVFLGLGMLRCALDPELRRALRRPLGVLGLAALVFAAWYLAADGGRGAAGPEGVHWLPWQTSLRMALLPFVGMRWDPVGWPFVGVWCAIAALLGVALWKQAARGEAASAAARFWVLAGALCWIGALALPFRMGHYSYINARLPAVAFLGLGMALRDLAVAGWLRAGVVAGVVLALGLVVQQQARLSTELERVAPLLERLPIGASLLPLVFDDDSPELEPSLFDFHLHVHHYAHLRRGARVTPYFFPHPLVPVRYREGSPSRAPPAYQPGAFRFEEHAGWEFLLVRGAPPRFLAYLGTGATEIARSGRWRLFQRHVAPE